MSLAGAAGVAIDNARLYEEARDRQRWLEASADVTAVLLAGNDTSDALHLIASRARDMTEPTSLSSLLPPATAPSRGRRAGRADDRGRGRSGRRPLRGSAHPDRGSTSGAVFADHVPRNVRRLAYSLDGRHRRALGPALALPLGSGDAPAACCSPSASRVRRRSTTTSCRWCPPSPTRPRWPCNAPRCRRPRRELQALTERDRIATDLHDHVIQRLFAVGDGDGGHPTPGRRPADRAPAGRPCRSAAQDDPADPQCDLRPPARAEPRRRACGPPCPSWCWD